MKLQFNLLPDVKQEYLKTKRTKRTVITASAVASIIALFILLTMITTVYVVNKKQLNDADSDIKKYSKQLQDVKNLDKILTIQNQLTSLQQLHQSKHKMSRIYTYLPQVTPAHVCISQLSIDTTSTTMNFQGTSESQKSINTFVDTLKFTKYKLGGQNSGKYAFPSVIESQFGISSTTSSSQKTANSAQCQGAPAPAGYQLIVKYDPTLFSNSSDVTLDVPVGLVTTRSVLDNPSNIFNGDPNATTTQTGTSKTNGGQQ
jgi:Tfp pilus assembly protein PilN